MRIAILCLCLAGCATTATDGGNNELAMKVLGNLEHCDRTYTLGIGAGASGSMIVNCKAMPYEAK